MAVVEIYQRREIPEARVSLPSAENTFAEQFGNGLQNLGRAAIRAANAVQRADEVVRQKNSAAWLGKAKPQAMIDIDRQIDDLEANAQEGAPGHVAAVQKIITDYRDKLDKTAPDADSAAEMDSFMLAVEAERLGSARRFQKSSEIAQRSLNIDRGVSNLGGVVATKSDKLPWARAELDLMIDRQDLPADKAADLKRQSQLKLTDAYLGGLMIDHPEMVEKIVEGGSLDEYLDPADKPAWLARAKSRAESKLQTELALADRADRDAEREIRKRGDVAAKDLWAKFADGKLTRDQVDAARDTLDPTDYRALVTASARPGADRDNPQAIAAIEDAVGAPDFLATLDGALDRGEITTDTYRSYRNVGRKLGAENVAGTAYAMTYGYIKNSLGSGGFLFGNNSEAARQATRNALQEFDLWAHKNPDAPIEQFDLVGRTMVDRYRAFTWDSMSAGTGLPAFYSGTRDGLTGAKIDEAELTALMAFDTGAYSREQFLFELKKLNDWREILKRKAAQ
jgi:hypothetical protein